MGFIFDLPAWLEALLVIGGMSLLAVGGLLWFRRHVLHRLRFRDIEWYLPGAMVPTIMVFYGIVMGLISVHAWQGNQDAQAIASREATALAMLYRDVSEYPEPQRQELQNGIREYVEYVIREAWPLQRKGHIPAGGVEMVDRIQRTLMSFEPATEAQKLLAAEALRAYNGMVEARRMRLDAVRIHLPAQMWYVILIGAVIGFLSSYFFPVEDTRVHLALVALLGIFVGLVTFLIVALDRPFRGDLAVPPSAYELVYDHLMKR